MTRITLSIVNFLHRRRIRGPLLLISRVMYYLKGFGSVAVTYRSDLKAYVYRVCDVTYLSKGPGWVYSYKYLLKMLEDTYNYHYVPKDGDCVLDIGAGLGEEVVVYSQLVGSSGKVYAIEASESVYRGLKYMVEENGFTQTSIFNAAIYKSVGKIKIEDNPHNYLVNTISEDDGDQTNEMVKSVTLDHFVKSNSISRIDFLKCNIEGAEKYLIEGMSDSVHLIKNMCISCHDFRARNGDGEFYITKEMVRRYLIKNGFSVSARATGNTMIDDLLYGTRT